ncbi:MAG: lipid A deacylase LpxR family protein [Desulfobacterales bacterium]|nr:lipid A deacylase LpxR family protein [Desulfobacterales bacterium]
MPSGNAYTGANLGSQVRFGRNIPNDFGTFLIRPWVRQQLPLDDTDPRLLQSASPFRRPPFLLAVDGKSCGTGYSARWKHFPGQPQRQTKSSFVADFIGGVGVIIQRVKITWAHALPDKRV